MVNVTINGKTIQVKEGTSILQAAKEIDVRIPTLCHNPDLPAWASCGICIVRLAGTSKMIRACCTAVTEGMNIITHDPEIVQARRTVLELILSNHPDDCLRCSRNNRCELQSLAAEFGLRTIRFDKILKQQPIDDSNDAIVLDRDKCINCGRCVEACQLMQNVWALEYTGRGDKTMIGPVGGVDLAHSPCVRCGQCAVHCPTGAIASSHSNRKLWDRLCDPEITTVVQIAPAVRVAIGEEFGLEPGEISSKKIYTALRRIGFNYVFDTNFGADLTIMEEATEFVQRVTQGGVLPMFTSCCPGWVDYAEKNYHDLLPHLSTAKSPQQIQGAITKTYWAEKMGLDPAKVCSVSVMPCTAKKYESRRDESMKSSGFSDVDISITTREFARLIRQAGIDFASLEESEADSPLGGYTGAGTIFGATGGVMEAAVRSAYYFVTKEELGNIELTPVRGLDNIKACEIDVAGKKLKLAVVHQLGNVDAVVQEVLEAKREGKELPYHFIEVMACRGGCVSGGGQPYGSNDEIRAKRAAGLYQDDKNSEIRVSHKNPDIITLYNEYLKEPCGEKSHHLLHTHYTERELYNYQ
ncbi:MAG: NADH-dependent [FeFe] hydrogenase, group A6 [Candidatus Treponema excrementipullorum]|nr:NADH-dependent [FeFe] hydrogenase, group A6 [Spirochaetia bacterium]MDD7012888.1 NADH-dependent [FeFe] hydrogenase, group A6 [Candidatus Treponema excrementipullorum]MDY4707202.1 NADH-dependent [FeFe] hydrogenase, group A6 [Candidatus Treponema excrementipullorum]